MARAIGLNGAATLLAAAALFTGCSPEGAELSLGPDGRWVAPPGSEADPASIATCPADAAITAPEPVEVVSGLSVPWDLAFLPDGRILVVERGGTIRQIVSGELLAEPWATIDVRTAGETGLLGLAVDPDHASNGHVYVVATTVDSSIGARIGRLFARLLGDRDATAWANRIIRLTDADGRGTDPTVVVSGLEVGPLHAGAGLRFGPDGRLYVGIGDGGVPQRAPDRSSDGGKIHVIDLAAGTPPAVHASGLRNPQSFDFHPVTGALLAADHGPTGLPAEGRRIGHDELNVIVAGEDYGWPTVAGRWRGEGVPGLPPLAEWQTSIAPAGMTVVDAPASAWHGDVILSSLVQGQLVHLSLELPDPGSDSLSVRCATNLYIRRFGRLRAVHQGPDGDIWFTTSNRDQRGTPGERDDRLFRFSPPAAPADGAP